MVLHLGLNHKLESENDPQFISKYLWILLNFLANLLWDFQNCRAYLLYWVTQQDNLATQICLSLGIWMSLLKLFKNVHGNLTVH